MVGRKSPSKTDDMAWWQSALQKIDKSLKSRDTTRTGYLFYETLGTASEKGMLGDVRLPFLRPRREFTPEDTVESVVNAAILMEQEGGYRTEVRDLLHYLLQYGETALRNRNRFFKVLKESLMLQVRCGVYYGALTLIDYLVTFGHEVLNPIEKLAMYNNYAAIYVHLGDRTQAWTYYTKALQMIDDVLEDETFMRLVGKIAENNILDQLRQAIKNNLDGLSTGYDPDFIFLPD